MISRFNLGMVAAADGAWAQAESMYREGLSLARQRGIAWGVAGLLEGLAGVAAAQGRPRRAARIYGSAEAMRVRLGTPLPPPERASYEQSIHVACEALGKRAFMAAWMAGEALSTEQAVAEAIDDGSPLARHDTGPDPRPALVAPPP